MKCTPSVCSTLNGGSRAVHKEASSGVEVRTPHAGGTTECQRPARRVDFVALERKARKTYHRGTENTEQQDREEEKRRRAGRGRKEREEEKWRKRLTAKNAKSSPRRRRVEI